MYALPWGRALRAALLPITAENAQLPHLGPKQAGACSSPLHAHTWTGKLDRGMANRFSMGQTVIVSGFVSLRATCRQHTRTPLAGEKTNLHKLFIDKIQNTIAITKCPDRQQTGQAHRSQTGSTAHGSQPLEQGSHQAPLPGCRHSRPCHRHSSHGQHC